MEELIVNSQAMYMTANFQIGTILQASDFIANHVPVQVSTLMR